MAAGIAHASLAGMPSVSSRVNMTGHAGDVRHQPQHGYGHHSQSWFTQTFSQPAKPSAVLVLRSIKSSSKDVGISRQDLQTIHRMDMKATMVDEMLEYLAMEGHIYNTLDQHHLSLGMREITFFVFIVSRKLIVILNVYKCPT